MKRSIFRGGRAARRGQARRRVRKRGRRGREAGGGRAFVVKSWGGGDGEGEADGGAGGGRVAGRVGMGGDEDEGGAERVEGKEGILLSGGREV